MIANAGIAQVKPVLELTEDDVRRMFEVNVFGLFHSYRVAAKQMIKQGTPGKIIGCARFVSQAKTLGMLLKISQQYSGIQAICNALTLFGIQMGRPRLHTSICDGGG